MAGLNCIEGRWKKYEVMITFLLFHITLCTYKPVTFNLEGRTHRQHTVRVAAHLIPEGK